MHNKNSEKFSSEDLFTIELIPDEQDYKELMIDARLKWVSENNSHSPLKDFNMVDCQSEIGFFQNRIQELEQEKEQRIHQRIFQFKRSLQAIKTAEPPESAVNRVGPDHVVQEKIQQWREQEIREQEASCHDYIQLIAGRYNTLKQQSEVRINQAHANYQEAYRIWREERNGGSHDELA